MSNITNLQLKNIGLKQEKRREEPHMFPSFPITQKKIGFQSQLKTYFHFLVWSYFQNNKNNKQLSSVFLSHRGMEAVVHVRRDHHLRAQELQVTIYIKTGVYYFTWIEAKGGPVNMDRLVLSCLTLEHIILCTWQQQQCFCRRGLTIIPIGKKRVHKGAQELVVMERKNTGNKGG